MEKEEVKFFRLEERSKLSGFLELDVGPAWYHLIYLGATIQGQIVPVPPPNDGRSYFKWQRFFQEAPCIIEYLCAMPSGEKAYFY